MKLRYKYIHFEDSLDDDFNPAYRCFNNKTKEVLGYVEYYEPWKQYVFEGKAGCVFNISCLNDIMHFMGQLKTPPSAKGD